ncbi:MAG: DUF3307 domain-containing protein [Anaerolineae bacterium]
MLLHLFLRMYVGHLIGDFVLQPLWLAIAKRNGWPGLLLHVAVVTFSTAVMIWSVIPGWLLWSGVLFVVHLAIDQFRTFVFTDNSKGKGFLLLNLDQATHVASLLIISWLATGEAPPPMGVVFGQLMAPDNARLALFAVVIVLVWAAPILEVELLVAILSFKTPSNNASVVPINLSDRITGSLERVVGLSLGLLAPLAFVPRFWWMMRQNHNNRVLAACVKSGTSLSLLAGAGLLIWMTHLFEFAFK